MLSFLDSSGFRAVLRDCCPEIQALPAEELLRRYRKEAQAAELAHAASRNLGDDVNRDTMWAGSTVDTGAEVDTLSWSPRLCPCTGSGVSGVTTRKSP